MINDADGHSVAACAKICAANGDPPNARRACGFSPAKLPALNILQEQKSTQLSHLIFLSIFIVCLFMVYDDGEMAGRWLISSKMFATERGRYREIAKAIGMLTC